MRKKTVLSNKFHYGETLGAPREILLRETREDVLDMAYKECPEHNPVFITIVKMSDIFD